MGTVISVLGRYGLATFATAAVSGSHFLLQLAVLHNLGAADFGMIAFFMTLMQLGTGMCNALVAAPYTVSLHQPGEHRLDPDKGQAFACFFLANSANAILTGIFCLLAIILTGGEALLPAILFAMAAAVYSIRWFGRTLAYTRHDAFGAALADILYSACIVAGLALMWFYGFSATRVAAVFLAASCLSMAPLGLSFLGQHFITRWAQAARAYRVVWRQQARWALVGVLTTEATANAHSYIVVSFGGPQAFAPIAAAMLFLRPVGVCALSLTQLERPVMAKLLAEKQYEGASGTVRRFTLVLVAMCVLTIAAATVLFYYFPAIAFRPGLDAQAVVTAFGIWAVVQFILCIQTPRNVFLQSAGLFRNLANASIRACGVTILCVTGLLYLVGPVYSTLGIVAGQILMTAEIVMRARSVRISGMRASSGASGSPDILLLKPLLPTAVTKD